MKPIQPRTIVKLLGLSLVWGSQNVLGIEAMPRSALVGSVLSPNEHDVHVHYEKRSGLGLDPRIATDETAKKLRASIETTTIGLGTGFQGNWNLGISISGISSQSHIGNEQGFGSATARIEKLVNFNDHYKLALGSFIASGTEEATDGFSIAREKNASGGIFMRGIYDARTLKVDLGLGRTWRQPFIVDHFSFRHEWFYDAKLDLALTPGFSIISAILGRQIQFRDLDDERTLKQSSNSHGASLGVSGKFNHLTASIYGGQGDSFAIGRKIVGVELSMTLGKKSKSSESKTRLSRKDRLDKPRKPDSNPSEKSPEAPLGDQILADVSGKPVNTKSTAPKLIDDFELVDYKLKKSGLKESLQAEDDYADDQIQALKNLEKKRNAKKAFENRISETIRQQQLKDQIEEDTRTEQALTKKLKPEIEALPKISDEEASWGGLD